MRLVAIEYTVVNAREKGRFMATMTLSRLRQARYAILGFGCNQAFLFAMLYLGSYNESSQHGFLIDRADLLCVLLVMAATFALMTRERRRRHLMVVAEGLVRCYALPLVGALYLIVALHSLAPGIPWLALAAVEGLAAGVPLALLLCRWGRVLGEASIDQSVPEVFIGSALGAAVCFFVVAIPVEGAYILLYVLPVGSAWALRALGEPDDRDAEPAAADDPTEEAAKLSGRIIAGTVVYGLATGAVEALATSAEGGAASSLSVTFVLFVLYCAAALQLYGGRPLSVGVRAVLPTGPDQEVGPLGGAYRLAILLMVGGFVAVPLLESVNVSGVALHPDELHGVGLFGGEQALPQIDVLHRLFLRVLPAALQPAGHPVLVEGVHEVLRIRVHRHRAGALQSLQAHDAAEQLHAGVGGAGKASGELLLVHRARGRRVAQNGAVAARPGIAPGRAVGVQGHFHGGSLVLG